MPLKRITIDWGDNETIVSGGETSYYKNHKERCTKRCDNGNPCNDTSNCPSCRLRFGDSPDACEAKPFEFWYVYSCAGSGSTKLTKANRRI